MKGWLVSLVFLLMAALFAVDIFAPTVLPILPRAPKEERGDLRDPSLEPMYTRSQIKHKCNECHKNFQKAIDTRRGDWRVEHLEIVLDHGLNDRCLNCHHKEDRESFVNHDGCKIAYDQSQLLCAKCHGPKYRDWQNGVHGKWMGSWQSSNPMMKKVHCLSCHDPHSPTFHPILSENMSGGQAHE